MRNNLFHYNILNVEDLRDIQDSPYKVYETLFFFHFYFCFFIYLLILRDKLLLLHNSLIVNRKEHDFDIKNLILFIDCQNSQKQGVKVVSSSSVCSAINRSADKGYTIFQ